MRYKFFFLVLSTFACLHSKGQQPVENHKLMLPEALVSTAGDTIGDSDAWLEKRRPEILRMFEENVYGEVPKDFDSIRFEVKTTDQSAMSGNAVRKDIGIHVFRNNEAVHIDLLLFIPSQGQGPFPVFLLIDHREKDNTDPTRAVKTAFWPAEEVIARGYAVAAFQVSDVAPDDNKTYRQEVFRLYPEQLKKAGGMKAIGAWGWGAARVMDYFETDGDIDHSKVALIGHSRGGKAALWGAAQDQRFAMAISNNSGCTGAALARRQVGETIEAINTGFPYWFCDNYKKFNGKEDELPVDQHLLLALIAPRAVYVASASEDEWADPVGEFLAIKYAEPVFKLFDLAPLPAETQPPNDTPINSTNLAYHLRTGEHDLKLYDWEQYMNFADEYFSAKPVRAGKE